MAAATKYAVEDVPEQQRGTEQSLRESEARFRNMAAAAELGRIKRIEDPRLCFSGYAQSRVGDLEPDAVSGYARRRDSDHSGRLGERVGRVEHKVHHYLLDLRSITHDGGKIRREISLQHRRLRNRNPDQGQHLSHQPGQVHRLGVGVLVSRVDHQLTDDFGGADRNRLDGLDFFVRE